MKTTPTKKKVTVVTDTDESYDDAPKKASPKSKSKSAAASPKKAAPKTKVVLKTEPVAKTTTASPKKAAPQTKVLLKTKPAAKTTTASPSKKSDAQEVENDEAESVTEKEDSVPPQVSAPVATRSGRVVKARQILE